MQLPSSPLTSCSQEPAWMHTQVLHVPVVERASWLQSGSQLIDGLLRAANVGGRMQAYCIVGMQCSWCYRCNWQARLKEYIIINVNHAGTRAGG